MSGCGKHMARCCKHVIGLTMWQVHEVKKCKKWLYITRPNHYFWKRFLKRVMVIFIIIGVTINLNQTHAFDNFVPIIQFLISVTSNSLFRFCNNYKVFYLLSRAVNEEHPALDRRGRRCMRTSDQSCSRVQFFGPDPTHQGLNPTRPDFRSQLSDPTRPDPRSAWPDPTRPVTRPPPPPALLLT